MTPDINLPNNFPHINLNGINPIERISQGAMLKILNVAGRVALTTVPIYDRVRETNWNMFLWEKLQGFREYAPYILGAELITNLMNLYNRSVSSLEAKEILNCLSSHSMDLFNNAGIASYLNGTLSQCVPNIESLVGSDVKNCTVEYFKEFNLIEVTCQDENIVLGSGLYL